MNKKTLIALANYLFPNNISIETENNKAIVTFEDGFYCKTLICEGTRFFVHEPYKAPQEVTEKCIDWLYHSGLMPIVNTPFTPSSEQVFNLTANIEP